MKSQKAIRLSPNEEVAILRRQQEERRKARLIQVREQDRGLARRVRDGVHSKKEKERCVLDTHYQASLANAHQRELRELERRYLSRVEQFGIGHRDAQNSMKEGNRLQELRVLLEAEQKWRAEARHKAAMKELTANQLHQKTCENKSVEAKNKARLAEKERSRKVLKKPLPTGQPLIMDFIVSKGQRVQFTEAESYATSYYHIPHTVVQRDTHQSHSAHEMAQEMSEADKKLQKSAVVTKMEQDEKAEMRHKHALAKLNLEKKKTDVLSQLEILERNDRIHRQKTISKMPNNIFQPTHQRLEAISEQQRDMEQAFEKLFAKTRAHGVHSFGVLSQKCTDSSISQTTKNPADHPVVVLTPETNSCEDESMNISSVLHSSGPVRREKVQSSPLQRPPRREVHFSATDTSTSDSSYSTGPGTRHARVSPSRTRFVSRDSVPTHTKEQKHISTSPKQKQRSLSSDILPPSSSSPSRIQTSPLSKPRVANSPVTRSVMTEITNKRPKLPLASDKSVQTQSHPYSPPDLATHLSQPELSVSDTASSLSEKLLSKAARNRPVAKKSQLVQNHHSRPSHASKPPKPPVAKVPNETLQKLISMVHSQHEAWRERQLVAQQIPAELASQAKPSLLSEDEQEKDGSSGNAIPNSGTQNKSPSIEPMTRESTPSVDERDIPKTYPLSSRSNTHSPAPLSISQYYTTLDSSALSHQDQSPGEPGQQSELLNAGADSSHPYSPKPLSITPYNTTLEASLHRSHVLSPRSRVASSYPAHAVYSTAMEAYDSPGQTNDVDEDVQHVNFHRARLHLSPLDTRRNLSMSTTTAREDYGPLNVPSDYPSTLHSNTTSLDLSETVPPPSSIDRQQSLIDLLSGQDRFIKPLILPAPSLDITASSLSTVPSLSSGDLHKPRSQESVSRSQESFRLHFSSSSTLNVGHTQPGSILHPLHSYQRSEMSSDREPLPALKKTENERHQFEIHDQNSQVFHSRNLEDGSQETAHIQESHKESDGLMFVEEFTPTDESRWHREIAFEDIAPQLLSSEHHAPNTESSPDPMPHPATDIPSSSGLTSPDTNSSLASVNLQHLPSDTQSPHLTKSFLEQSPPFLPLKEVSFQTISPSSVTYTPLKPMATQYSIHHHSTSSPGQDNTPVTSLVGDFTHCHSTSPPEHGHSHPLPITPQTQDPVHHHITSPPQTPDFAHHHIVSPPAQGHSHPIPVTHQTQGAIHHQSSPPAQGHSHPIPVTHQTQGVIHHQSSPPAQGHSHPIPITYQTQGAIHHQSSPPAQGHSHPIPVTHQTQGAIHHQSSPPAQGHSHPIPVTHQTQGAIHHQSSPPAQGHSHPIPVTHQTQGAIHHQSSPPAQGHSHPIPVTHQTQGAIHHQSSPPAQGHSHPIPVTHQTQGAIHHQSSPPAQGHSHPIPMTHQTQGAIHHQSSPPAQGHSHPIPVTHQTQGAIHHQSSPPAQGHSHPIPITYQTQGAIHHQSSPPAQGHSHPIPMTHQTQGAIHHQSSPPAQGHSHPMTQDSIHYHNNMSPAGHVHSNPTPQTQDFPHHHPDLSPLTSPQPADSISRRPLSPPTQYHTSDYPSSPLMKDYTPRPTATVSDSYDHSSPVFSGTSQHSPSHTSTSQHLRSLRAPYHSHPSISNSPPNSFEPPSTQTNTLVSPRVREDAHRQPILMENLRHSLLSSSQNNPSFVAMSETSRSQDEQDSSLDEAEPVQYNLEKKLWDNLRSEQSSSTSEQYNYRESSSLISSEEERMYSLDSSMMDSSDNVHAPMHSSKEDNSSLIPSAQPFLQSLTREPSGSSSLSLQEAFLKKKIEFIKESQDRVKNIRASALTKQTKMASRQKRVKFSEGPHTETLESIKGSANICCKNDKQYEHVDLNSSERRKVIPLEEVRDNSLSALPPSHIQPMKPFILPSEQGGKILKADMKKRNLRFYNRLPEVRQKKKEENRNKVYAENRSKASRYQQWVRSKMQLKPHRVEAAKANENIELKKQKKPFK